jgi:hypothetical protein
LLRTASTDPFAVPQERGLTLLRGRYLHLCEPLIQGESDCIIFIFRNMSKDHTSMQLSTTESGDLNFVTALNLSSYNYLGFAESDLEMREEV